jgi:SAM-dependent methyltransferase
MRKGYIALLCCPQCGGELSLTNGDSQQGQQIEDGGLLCAHCTAHYPIVRGIPRFVDRENYASGFGLEWTVHARTQYDSYSGVPLSEQRFFSTTGWPRDMEGETILEVGSGSGRFTEQAAQTGALVVSMDYSYAVEANYASNGHRPNVVIVQADVYHMPFKPCFTKVFCFGMLQHTPDPHHALLALPKVMKPGGELALDVYEKALLGPLTHTKYWVRPLTRRMDPERLYRLTHRWVDLMCPMARALQRIPRIGRSLNWRLLVADYSDSGLSPAMLKEWAYLDTFDMLAPRYDYPQTVGTIAKWCEQAGLRDVEVERQLNAIQVRGRCPK